MKFKSLWYLFLIVFVGVLFSFSMVSVKADSGVGQTVDPTPVPTKGEKQNQQPRIKVEQFFSPTETGGPDAYGYEWDDSATYSWIPYDVSWTEVAFPDNDDVISNPILLGFTFPFYEKNYSTVYISTNGLLTFINQAKANSPSSAPMPFIEQPQALVAPFWDDLEVGGGNNGKVYYKQLSSPTRFVVSFIDITRLNADNDRLTFQVIFYPSGDIVFQYRYLTYDSEVGPLDTATVGIEDHDGAVGLTYLHKSDMAGLLHKALKFTRPVNTDHRPKALPLYQGAFAVEGQQRFDLNITNAGDVEQSFDLSVQNSDLSWQVQILDASNTLINETPELAPGSEYPIQVVFSAPTDAEVGSTATVNLSVKSSIDSSAVWTVEMQSTVPASFVQSVRDSGNIDLRAISKYGQREIRVFTLYTGSTMGVQSLEEAKFMNFWERNQDRADGSFWSEIEQAVVDDFGADVLYPTFITDNGSLASPTQYVYAESPVSAITSDGKIGVVWIQKVTRLVDGKSKYNVFMAILAANDTTVMIKEPFSVTENGDWAYPEFSSPRITVTPDNTFFVSWTQKSATESNIGIASYTSNGVQNLGARLYAKLSSVPGVTSYDFSTVYGLDSNRVILGYSSYDEIAEIYTPGYAVINTNGQTVFDPVLLNDVEGKYPVASRLGNGSIIYAWTKTETVNGKIIGTQVAYVLINPISYIASTHLELTTPDGLQGDYVSITPDEFGNVVFTWMDTDIERKLYYALVNASGSLVTLPMSYYEVDVGSTLLINGVGRGNAFYIYRFGAYLPLTTR